MKKRQYPIMQHRSCTDQKNTTRITTPRQFLTRTALVTTSSVTIFTAFPTPGSVVYAGISGIDGGNSAMMPAVRDIKEEK